MSPATKDDVMFWGCVVNSSIFAVGSVGWDSNFFISLIWLFSAVMTWLTSQPRFDRILTWLKSKPVKKEFNQYHPELRPGEMFLTNESSQEFFDQIVYKTKRAGNVAYDIYGKPVEGLFPIFAQRSEVEAE